MKNTTNKSTSQFSVASVLQFFSSSILNYGVILFLFLLLCVYGFVAFRIYVATGAAPSDAEVSSQLQAGATPHIDPKVVDQMQSLQDHSVNVQALFDQARNNPFGE